MNERTQCVAVALPLFVSCVAVFAHTSIQESARRKPSVDVDKDPVEVADTSAWKIREGEAAIERARAILGEPVLKFSKAIAKLDVLQDDRTPYLCKQIVDRPIWRVTLDAWRVVFSGFPEVKDKFTRTLDVYIDPTNGKLLKLETRWPEGESPIAPLPSAESATEQMRRHGNEVFHGFPEEPPNIGFFGALDGLARCGEDATVARQIIAHYVIWSRVGKWSEPRPVWAIMLRGTSPPPTPHREAPNDRSYHLKVIVDAKTGECVCASNTPSPEGP